MAKQSDQSLWLGAAAIGALWYFNKNRAPVAAAVPGNVTEQPVGLLPNTPQGLPILSQPTAPILPQPAPTQNSSWTQFGPVQPSVFTSTTQTPYVPTPGGDPNAPGVVNPNAPLQPPTSPVGPYALDFTAQADATYPNMFFVKPIISGYRPGMIVEFRNASTGAIFSRLDMSRGVDGAGATFGQKGIALPTVLILRNSNGDLIGSSNPKNVGP